MKIYKRLSALLLSLLAVMLFPVNTFAADSIDSNHSNSLTVMLVYGQKPILGMRFDAYLISTVDKFGNLTVIDRYKDYIDELDIQVKDDERLQTTARILAREIVLDDSIKPDSSSVTNADGVAKFLDIPMGLYLIIGRGVEKDDYVYTTSPFFAMMPERYMDSNTWNYSVVVNAKPEQNPIKADFEVIKIWNDDCHKDQRAKSITINLICDGKVYDAITLPYNGAWSYTWKDLNTNHLWTVTENSVEGYKTEEIRQEGNTFIVTNTCNKPTTPTDPGKPTLPHTGLLWWPVPVLIAAGLLFVLIGLIRRRGACDER